MTTTAEKTKTTTTKKSTTKTTKTTKMQTVGRVHMRVKKVDFSNVTQLTIQYLKTYQVLYLAQARLANHYTNVVAGLMKQIETIDERCATEDNRPRTPEEEEAVHAIKLKLTQEETKNTDRKSKINEEKKKVMNYFFKDREYEYDLFNAYKKMVENGRNADATGRWEYIHACVDFLKKMGCIDKYDNKANSGSAEIRRIADILHDAVGYKMQSGKFLLENPDTEMLTTNMNKNAFQTIFLATFRDILVSNNVLEYKEDQNMRTKFWAELLGSDIAVYPAAGQSK